MVLAREKTGERGRFVCSPGTKDVKNLRRRNLRTNAFDGVARKG